MSQKSPKTLDLDVPKNLLAEETVIASILLDPEWALPKCLSRIVKGDFFRDSYDKIYSAMVEVNAKGYGIDTTTVAMELQKRNHLELVGGVTFLSHLIDTCALPSNLDAFLDALRLAAMQRELMYACQRIQEDISTGSGDPEDILRNAQRRITEIRVSTGFKPAQKVGDLFRESMNAARERSANPDKINRWKSGIPCLDRITGGFRGKQSWVCAARPGTGKSALGLGLAWHGAYIQQLPIVYFSLEMSGQEICERLAANLSGVSYLSFTQDLLTPDELDRIDAAHEAVTAAPLFIRDCRENINTIREEVGRIQTEVGQIGGIIIDHLLLVDGQRGQSIYERVTENSREIKSLAMEFNAPCFTLSQLNRECDQRRPILSNLRSSGDIEADADGVLFLWCEQEELTNPQRRIEAIVAKNRTGVLATSEIIFSPDEMRLYESYEGGWR